MDRQDRWAKSFWCAAIIVIVLGALIPKPIWIAIAALATLAILTAFTALAISAYSKLRSAIRARTRANHIAKANAARQVQLERSHQEHRHRVLTLGQRNAESTEFALAAIKRIEQSEAARTGWLGELNFTSDISAIINNFQNAHALKRVADQLAAAEPLSPDECMMLSETRTAIAELERAANHRVQLIARCGQQTDILSNALQHERVDTHAANRRAELHAQLSGMLYGIKAQPIDATAAPAAEALIARVQAFHDIKGPDDQSRRAAARQR